MWSAAESRAPARVIEVVVACSPHVPPNALHCTGALLLGNYFPVQCSVGQWLLPQLHCLPGTPHRTQGLTVEQVHCPPASWQWCWQAPLFRTLVLSLKDVRPVSKKKNCSGSGTFWLFLLLSFRSLCLLVKCGFRFRIVSKSLVSTRNWSLPDSLSIEKNRHSPVKYRKMFCWRQLQTVCRIVPG